MWKNVDLDTFDHIGEYNKRMWMNGEFDTSFHIYEIYPRLKLADNSNKANFVVRYQRVSANFEVNARMGYCNKWKC